MTDPFDYGSVIANQAGDEPEPSDTCPRCGSRCPYEGFCEPCTIQLEADREEVAA